LSAAAVEAEHVLSMVSPKPKHAAANHARNMANGAAGQTVVSRVAKDSCKFTQFTPVLDYQHFLDCSSIVASSYFFK